MCIRDRGQGVAGLPALVHQRVGHALPCDGGSAAIQQIHPRPGSGGVGHGGYGRCRACLLLAVDVQLHLFAGQALGNGEGKALLLPAAAAPQLLQLLPAFGFGARCLLCEMCIRDRGVEVFDARGLELLFVLLLVDLGEDVLEGVVVFLADGILGGEPQILLCGQRIVKAAAGKALDGGILLVGARCV